MHGRIWISLHLAWLPPLAIAVGCSETNSPAPEQAQPAVRPAALTFDAANTGTIRGRVTWPSEIPEVPSFEVRANLPHNHPGHTRPVHTNPNAPSIDKTKRSVAGAIVFLRDVDSKAARPWDHPPVCVEQRDSKIHVVQGASRTHVGFVRAGDEIEMVSRQPLFHALRFTGAANFTLAFPDPDKPLRRRLAKPGLVELSSGAGYYWMRGYLFVVDHPYYTRTDAQGRFELLQVPAGSYRLVCWLPNWRKAGHDRDPETSLIVRHYFSAPLEQEHHVTVRPLEPVQGNETVPDFPLR